MPIEPGLYNTTKQSGILSLRSNKKPILCDSTRKIITYISHKGYLKSIWLPNVPEGRYVFEQTEDDRGSDALSIEARDGKWYAFCTKPSSFLGPDTTNIESVEIISNNLYPISGPFGDSLLFAEEMQHAKAVYRNYLMPTDDTISIGRSTENDIVYENKYVSKKHLTLTIHNRTITLRDQNSSNGVFVNGKRVEEAELKIGDVIYVMGLRMITGVNFLSICSGYDDVIISHKMQPILSTQQLRLKNNPPKFGLETTLFNRLPRKRKALIPPKIEVEPPPMSLEANNLPMLLRMGGSMVMSGSALLAGNFTSILSMVLFPVLSQKYTDKQKKEYEALRTEKYGEYLENKAMEIQNEISKEESILNENYPPVSNITDGKYIKDHLWERRKTDDDFLSFRIGTGSIPMMAECEFPARGFEVFEDPLLSKMYEVVEAPNQLHEVPILSSFVENFVSGVVGNKKHVIRFVQELIFQLSILHSYDEVKLVMLCSDEDEEHFEFTRYLPHTWNDQKDFRFMATNQNEALQISKYLKSELNDDLSKDRELKSILKERPYYFVITLNKNITDSMEILKDVMQEDNNRGVSIVAAYDDLPKECTKIYRLNPEGKNLVDHIKLIEKDYEYFQSDLFEQDAALACMRQIANTRLKLLSTEYSLPKVLSFLEMYGAGRVEHLNCVRNWQENNPVKSLGVRVGVNTDGSPFLLDLHEKYQGPHGLVAGMTGSGKSEFIISYILSMAVSFHPNEVAFVLIDYKGGGLAGAFDDKTNGIHLPHLVGTITNLDGSAIQRSLMSIQSELIRRQRIFNEAKTRTNEGTMDIYTYQNLYRNHQVEEPLPHLFIISDEFAELKQQEPEFMDQLISAARIGRSLGVHLILATQKPAGVVNDQIWSNTKFRVCLRVQDRSDSQEMLKRPEAAELKDTGRFYLQVGYNELFALGQSAWCGANYEPQDQIVVQRDEEIQFIDLVGQVLAKGKPKAEKTDSGVKQIVAIVKYLSDIAKREGIVLRQLWQEPLPKYVYLDEITENNAAAKRDKVEVILGLVDDPMRQSQYPLVEHIQEDRNLLIVGESSSGKTTLIQTLLYALVRDYSPEEVNFYVLDYSSRNLKMFQKVPHCGAVLMSEQENDVLRLMDLIQTIITERKRLFSEAGISNYDSYTQVAKLPIVLLVIDNLAVIDEFSSGRDIQSALMDIMKNGISYGVKIVASVTQFNDCPYRMQNEFGSRLALQAKDRFAYTNILNMRCVYTPPEMPGRGMCLVDGTCNEFHVALAVNSINEQERSSILASQLKKFSEKYENCEKAVPLELVSEEETYEEFCQKFKQGRIPLGYVDGTPDKVAIPFQQLNSVSLYFGNPEGILLVLKNFLYAARQNGMACVVIRNPMNSCFTAETVASSFQGLKVDFCEGTPEQLTQLVGELNATFQERTAIRKEFCTTHGITNWQSQEAVRQWREDMRKKTQPILILFESFAALQTIGDLEISKSFETFFHLSVGYNVYFIGCFYPDDEKVLEQAKKKRDTVSQEQENTEKERLEIINYGINTLFKEFNPEKFTMLFGGQFDKQKLLTLPYEYEKIKEPVNSKNLNRFLLYYRNKLHMLKMPCGKLQEQKQDKDDESAIL